MHRRVLQSGGIVLRGDAGGMEVLLVRSKKDPTVWVFPKGHIEDGETAAAAAIRETWEEAGVRGELGAAVGAPMEFTSGDEPVSVQYFVVRVRAEEPSPEGRDKRWLSIGDALRTLSFDSARAKLREAVGLAS